MKKVLFFCLGLLVYIGAAANHIVGGYMSYRYISGTTYEITLTVWRDCNSSTLFDGEPGSQTPNAFIGIFANGAGSATDVLQVANPIITQVLPPTNNPCLTPPANVCVEQGEYIFNYTFPSATTGYTIAYVRCCRNTSITNVANPGNEGAVYSAYVPPTNTYANSSPTFNSLPPLFVCSNAPWVFDYSASDIDGDVLRYSLCNPYSGGSAGVPAPNPPPAPPYGNINWQSGYSIADLMGGTPPVSIDSVTGVITGNPATVGQFVIGVCVSEYRNGVLIGTYLRDYQVNVTPCNAPIANIPSSNINPGTGVGTYTVKCNDNMQVQFQNNSQPSGLSYQWDFGDPTTTADVSTAALPTYTYPDTGVYLVQLIASKNVSGSLCSDTTYAYVYIYPNGVADFSAQSVCPNAPDQFTDLSGAFHGTPAGWSWDFGDGTSGTGQNPTHTYTTGGTFIATLTMTTSDGCVDTVQKQVFIYPGNNSNFNYTPPCIFQPVTFSLSNNSNIVTYNWTLSDGSTSTQPAVVYTYNTGGSYPVTLITSSVNGCTDTTTKLITVQEPVTALVDSAANACAGYPVQLNASGGLYYQWIPPDGLSDPKSSSPVAMLDSNTTFTVIVSNDCFSDTTTADVIVRPLPMVDAGPDTTIYRDTYAWLHGTTNGIQYFWNPSTWLDEPYQLNTKAEPKDDTWYELWAINEWGCSNKDSILISVVGYDIMDIPTGFSPNGDGVNDVFRIARWLNVAKLEEFAVFNRWGQKIFSTSAIDGGWDGTFKGQSEDIGVYAWYVVARTEDGKELLRKGNVTLIR